MGSSNIIACRFAQEQEWTYLYCVRFVPLENRNFAAYTKCLQKVKTSVCGSKDIPAHPEVKLFLHNKYNEYKWYCDSRKIGSGRWKLLGTNNSVW